MPNRLIILAVRKEGMSFENFREHYETVHIPLMQKLGGKLFPISHHRRYALQTGPATPFDCVAELLYRDASHMQAHAALLKTEWNAQIVADDCGKFLNLTQTVNYVVGEDVDTTQFS